MDIGYRISVLPDQAQRCSGGSAANGHFHMEFVRNDGTIAAVPHIILHFKNALHTALPSLSMSIHQSAPFILSSSAWPQLDNVRTLSPVKRGILGLASPKLYFLT